MRCSLFIAWTTVVLLLQSTLVAYGQTTATLTGLVGDATTGKPMPFANVYVNGSTRGAVTDEKGAFTLVGIPLGTVEIVASFIGYESEKRTFRFDNASPQKADFRLKASAQTLETVIVRGNQKQREQQLRQFKKELLGEPFGGQCQLVNSDVLYFNEENNHLYATVNEPLVVENQALGYRLVYDLQHFDAAASGKTYSAGTARFEEIKPETERQANRFRRNRLAAYQGSIRHLMATLVDNTFEQAGFMVFQEDVTKPMPADRKSITLAAAISEYKRLIPVKAATLIQPGKLSTERRLVSSMKLIVFYRNAPSNFSPYPDARYEYTEISLPSGHLQLATNGVITKPEGMVAQGSMGDDRLSTMLPAEWQPDANAKESLTNDPLAIQGKIALPDSSLKRITAAFSERFKWLAPTLFIDIDKPFYATGDRLWVSTYLLDAVNHQRASGETAIHVDLLTPTGKLVQHQWVRIVEGRGSGDFRLSDTLTTGKYHLRAYTDEDDAQRRPAFERSVTVYNLLRSSNASMPNDSIPKLLDVQILPEGGRWIAGLPARLGVKILQPNGHGLAIGGRIVDDLGVEVVGFKTNQQGMTSVLLEPKAQRTYYADLTYNNQPQRIALPKPEMEGLLLSADATSDTTRLMLTIRSSKRTVIDSAYVVIQQQGRVIDQRKILLQNGVAKINLPITTWPAGLAQITLYDAIGKAQAERLVFVPEAIAPVRIVTSFNKNRYQPREQAILSINLSDNGAPVLAALSASITDADQVFDDTAEANIHTHLLLTGELRGRIETPNQYLKNRSAETLQALDDLLLTQGWRRVSGTPETEQFGGVSLKGRILNAKNQPIPGAKLTVVSTGVGKSFVGTAGADEQGRFRLVGMAATDTLQLMVQIMDEKSRKLSVKEAFLALETSSSQWKSGRITASPDWLTLRAESKAARIRQDANADFYRDKTAQVLQEVTVRARKSEERPEDIQQRSLHSTADAVLIIDDKFPVFPNLYEMIQGRLTGVTVQREGAVQARSYKVFMRGVNSFKSGMQPLYVIDGVPINDPDGTALLNYNAGDIERVEVLKNSGAAGIYGIRGGNGVIAFYSKGARSMQKNSKTNEGMTPIEFIGYPSVQREFYVPRYDTEVSADSVAKPVDYRDVLYWKPLMQTDGQGRSQLRFPLSDVVRTVRVVIQGITADGRPVVGVQLIRVQ